MKAAEEKYDYLYNTNKNHLKRKEAADKLLKAEDAANEYEWRRFASKPYFNDVEHMLAQGESPFKPEQPKANGKAY